MNKRIEEKDFDFTKKETSTVMPAPTFENNMRRKLEIFFSNGFVCFVCAGTLLALPSFLQSDTFKTFIFPNTNTNTTSSNSSASLITDSFVSFKAVTPADFQLIQNSLINVFSLNASLYKGTYSNSLIKDKSSVRTGLTDFLLDKAQSDLLKYITPNIDLKDVKDSLLLRSTLDKISIVSFDSTTKTFILDVDYSLATTAFYTDSKLEISASSHEKQQISVTLNSHSHIKEIKILNSEKLKNITSI